MSIFDTAEQYQLFDTGLNLSKLRQAKERLMRSTKSPNTMKAYGQSWKDFTRWCDRAGRAAHPASPDTVGLWVVWAATERRYRLKTIHLALSSIQNRHEAAGFPSPVDREVKALLAAHARETKERPRGKQHLTVEQLRRICRAFDEREPIDVRDRALILLGYASCWRRSELSRLACEDLRFEPQGVRLFLPHSKTDQEARGRTAAIPYGRTAYTCPVRALKEWLAVRGSHPGPVFVQFRCGAGGRAVMAEEALGGFGICYAVKRALERVGIDAKAYGAHSLRSGAITTAAEHGASLRAIMDRSGHKTVQVVMRYVRSSADAFRADPLAGVL